MQVAGQSSRWEGFFFLCVSHFYGSWAPEVHTSKVGSGFFIFFLFSIPPRSMYGCVSGCDSPGFCQKVDRSLLCPSSLPTCIANLSSSSYLFYTLYLITLSHPHPLSEKCRTYLLLPHNPLILVSKAGIVLSPVSRLHKAERYRCQRQSCIQVGAI